MQLSTIEKDDLLNGIRNAAVAVHTAKATFLANKTDETRKALRAARDTLGEVLETSYTKIVAGLDVEICGEEYSYGGLYCTAESIDAEVGAPEDTISEAEKTEHPDTSTPDTGNI